MKQLFTLLPLSRSLYIVWMITAIVIAFFSYMILAGFLMGWFDVSRVMISVPASCILVLIYFITRRLIDVYKYLGIIWLYYFFILYNIISYDSMLHNWVANINGFIYWMIGNALAFLLVFVPKLWNTDIAPVENQGIAKYQTALQIIFLVIVASVIPNILIPSESSIYQSPIAIQESFSNNKIDTALPTQNYWSYLDNNQIKNTK